MSRRAAGAVVARAVFGADRARARLAAGRERRLTIPWVRTGRIKVSRDRATFPELGRVISRASDVRRGARLAIPHVGTRAVGAGTAVVQTSSIDHASRS